MNAILLAGGKSRRFKENKAIAKYNGERLIEGIANLLNKHFHQVYLVVDSKEKYTFVENCIIIEDVIPNKGPVGGIYTGLLASEEKYNYIMACDMPLMSGRFLEYIKNWEQNFDVLLPKYNGYIEPLAGIYSKNCLPIIEKNLGDNKLSIRDFLKEVKMQLIDESLINRNFPNKNIFYNINYQKDLEALQLVNGG
ncbi:MAG TPA: molybdenum cofactor guanylyltransferase [Clostridia bacterium]|nr:molybdenum cofactor guanylyltransferase [Clostridia bacterium]